MEKTNRKTRKTLITLSVFVAVLGIMTVVFAVLYAINKTGYDTTSINLENIYQRSFYDLVDNVNNTEVKLAKVLSSSDSQYNKKLLAEIHENSNKAQNNLSYLPISINGIPDTIKFINQVDGYTKTLSEKDKLNTQDIKTLSELYDSLVHIKAKLNETSQQIIKGYNISLNSKDVKTDFTQFTKLIQTTKGENVDYPTMIYDGPFADTVLNQQIKGLNFAEISENEAKQIAEQLYSGSKISFAGESKGKFNTYDYNIKLSNGIECYAQFTKKGGKLLTLSSYAGSSKINYTKEQAIEIAEEFAKKQGINDVECVWSDVVGNDAYINLAPVKSEIIYYPDLVKVKVDLSSGMVLGWESTTYYTNHRERTLPEILYSASKAKNNIDSSYIIESIKLSLSPIEDTNQEVLTHEIKCTKEGSVYYFYIDVETGKTVNILKVVETDNGNLLM
jgi:germination protein YpeB